MTPEELSKVCGGDFVTNHCAKLDSGLANLQSMPGATAQASTIKGAMTGLGCWDRLQAAGKTVQSQR